MCKAKVGYESKGTNSKTFCPYCSSYVRKLGRHLKEYHRYSNLAAKLYAAEARRLGRDGRIQKIPAKFLNKKVFVCPIKKCTSVVARIDKHFKLVHGVKKGDAEFRKYMTLIQMNEETYTRLVKDKMVEISSDDDEQCSDDPGEIDDCPGPSSHDLNIHHNQEVSLDMIEESNLFMRWMGSIGGGSKSLAACKQNRYNVITFLKAFGCDFSSESVVANLERLETGYIPETLKAKQATTVKGYFLSFKKFLFWAKLKQRRWISHETKECIDMQIEKWNQTLKDLIILRSLEKKREERDKILNTAELTAAYFESPRPSEAKLLHKKLKDVKNVSYVSTKDFFLLRNYLIMMLSLSNGSRAGPILNMCLDDVAEAKRNDHGEMVIINVRKHKTTLTHGEAQSSLTHTDFEVLVTFVNKVRPLYVKNSSVKNVFISTSGNYIQSSDISTAITKEFSASSGRMEESNCTVIRKSIVSLFSRMGISEEEMGHLATLMKHSRRMQKDIYDHNTCDSNMARMSSKVRKAMSGEQICPADSQRAGLSNAETDNTESSVTSEIPMVDVSSESMSWQGTVKECSVRLFDLMRPDKGKHERRLKKRLTSICNRELKQKYVSRRHIKKVLDSHPDIMAQVFSITHHKDLTVNTDKLHELCMDICSKKKLVRDFGYMNDYEL